jgi:hypothetical protein
VTNISPEIAVRCLQKGLIGRTNEPFLP